MKDIIYQHRTSLRNHMRLISFQEKSEEGEYITNKKKLFIYSVSKQTHVRGGGGHRPDIYLTKVYSSKAKRERFIMRVKGTMYVIQNDELYQIHYAHIFKLHVQRKVESTGISVSE